MSRSIVDRVISAYGAEGDDAFRPVDIIEFINSANEKAVSMLTRMEKNSGTTLRSLDQLRYRENILIEDPTTEENGYKVAEVPMPTNFLDVLHSSYVDMSEQSTRRMRELRTDQLTLLEMGNTKPNWLESFYHIISNETGKIFEVYADEISEGIDKIRVYYVREPIAVTETDISLPDLPEYLTQAVIYGACEKMALKTEDASIEAFANKFLSELKNNAI